MGENAQTRNSPLNGQRRRSINLRAVMTLRTYFAKKLERSAPLKSGCGKFTLTRKLEEDNRTAPADILMNRQEKVGQSDNTYERDRTYFFCLTGNRNTTKQVQQQSGLGHVGGPLSKACLTAHSGQQQRSASRHIPHRSSPNLGATFRNVMHDSLLERPDAG